MDEVLISISEFCRRFGVGKTKAYELLASGRISAVQEGTRTLIIAASALKWAGELPPYASNVRSN